jgi:type II secretion system protein G
VNRQAFTLIELLVVVAVIAILAAIALPNFLEAQTRAKVSRALADLRTIATALEVYRIDNNQYPANNYPSPLLETLPGGQFLPNRLRLLPLTTPVAHLTALPTDPFASDADPLNKLPPPVYHYASANDPFLSFTAPFFLGEGNNEDRRPCLWVLQSDGPDRNPDQPHWQFPRYDATNGTVSAGNIIRMGP